VDGLDREAKLEALAAASFSVVPLGNVSEICLRLRIASRGSAVSTWRLSIR
jgi:hypothetical protein